MPSDYTSFRIQNTTDIPILLSVTDPEGNAQRVGRLKPGKESVQVAPAGASWSIQRSKQDPEENIDSPAHGSLITILPDHFRIELSNEPASSLPEDSTNTEPIPYEAFLKLETGSHSARINQLLVTPDGKSLITSGEDKTIRIWDIETRKQTGLLLGQIGDGKEGRVHAIAVTPDGKYLATLVWVYPQSPDHRGREGEIRESDLRVFELATGNLQARYHYAGTLSDLDFSPDGAYLALTCNPKNPPGVNSGRRGYICFLDSQTILHGFGTLSVPGENHMSLLYDTFGWDMVLPSYARFIPQEKPNSTDVRLVVATWIYNPGGTGAGEYTGRIYWYACSPEGLQEIQSCETEKTERNDPPGIYSIRPESLAVSREFVITAAGDAAINEFFCHNHQGESVTRVLSETMPTGPAFSKDGSQLIVGQIGDSGLVQIKVYNTAGGQFQLKSTYYGHGAETNAVAILEDGTAVSAGGDQNTIHFWKPAHLEGKQIAVIQGIGRTVRAVGMDEQEQIAIGNYAHMLLDDGRIAFQRIFDLRSLTLRPFSLRDHYANFQRSQTLRGEKNLVFERREPYVNLYLDPQFLSLIHGDWYKPTTFGFTQKGTVITGADDGKVRIVARERDGWHSEIGFTPEGEPMDRTLVGHTARVLDHAAGTKWLATAGKDQTVRLWYMEDVEQEEMTDLEPALNLFVGMDDEWVLWSKSGYYTASQNGDRYLGYHINRGPDKEALFFSSDRFQSVFFRPDIIKAILMYGSEERVSEKEAESRISIRPINVAGILPPIIELEQEGVNQNEWGDRKEGYVDFTLTVEAHGKPISRLCVLRNGRLVRVEKTVPSSGKFTISRLPLLPGVNHFKIFAENQVDPSHPIKSNPIEHTVNGKGRYEDEALVKNGMLYVLAAGVSIGVNLKPRTNTRQEGTFALNFAHKDADAIYNRFTIGNHAFDGVESILLVNEQSTRQNILASLDDICNKIRKRDEDRVTTGEAKRDVLLVFLSGHGVYRRPNQQLYFWNYDYDPECPGETGLSFVELGEKITALPAEVILMTDACHSGMAGGDVLKGFDADQDGIDPNELAKRIYGINESDMYIFSAARRSESAREGSSVEHGYFTKAILDTLAESINRVTMIGLIDQVQWRVQRYTGAQNPVCRMYGDLLPLEIYKK